MYIREDCLVLRDFCLGLLTFAINAARGAAGWWSRPGVMDIMGEEMVLVGR